MTWSARLSVLLALNWFAWGCCLCPPALPPPPTQGDSGTARAPGVNRPPRVEALFATSAGARLRVVRPGDTVRVVARASDADGDVLTYRWQAGTGGLDIGSTVDVAVWTPGPAVGVGRVTVSVSDGRGGTAQRTLEIPVDTVLAFRGQVVDPQGRPVVGARVSVSDQETETDAEGGFTAVTSRIADDRYALTIEHPRYGLYSQVFDGPVDGLVIRLTPGTTVLADPRQPITVQDGAASQCTGPLSAQVDWTLFPRQREAQVFDSNGQPWTGPVPPGAQAAIAVYEQAIPCSPGISVSIPANALVDASGQVPQAPVEITVATADLYAPGGMPGDYTALQLRRNLGMQTFGAGTVSAWHQGEPLQLADTAEVTLTIPVDPLHFRSETPLDSVVPFLLYDAGAARWVPHWSARLRPDGRAYEARVDHLSAFNTDLIKTDQSCVRIESAGIAGDYTLEATIPLPSAAPSIRSNAVDNTPETLHALYNLPSSTWIVLVPFRQEASGPVPLGTFVVNTGPPQVPTDPNRPVYPYDACQSEVSLEEIPGETMIVVDGRGRANGPLPIVWYALTEPTGQDIYPLDPNPGAFALCGLFDTGATRIAINDLPPPNRACGPNFGDSDTGHLSLTANVTVNVRLNGLAMQASDGSIPIGEQGSAAPAQLEIQGVVAEPRPEDVTLLGTPVTMAAVAVIDYTTTITTPTFVVGPDITLFVPGDPNVPTADVTLTLERYGTPERHYLSAVVFAQGGATYQDQTGVVRFLYDTGTTPTIVGNNLATALGLGAATAIGSCLSGNNNRYEIDSITMTGSSGIFRVENAVVCWDQASIFGPYEAVIGSNLFDQVTLVFNGVQNTLGVKQ